MSGNLLVRGLGLAVLLAGGAFSLGAGAASSSAVRLLDARVDLEDRPSLQRGAKLFVNYCVSCHSASFMRYNRVGRDLGIDEELLRENLMLAAEKPGEPMSVAMRAEDAEAWFGTTPPDLSVIARSRGADYLYTYLMTFYADDSRPTGANNLVFRDVSMPHVLSELQGTQVLREAHAEADEAHPIPGARSVNQLLELQSAGHMGPAEYRGAARDLTNFMVYMGEPAKLQRYRVGSWVLLFLVVLYLLSRSLYKEYWKDVH